MPAEPTIEKPPVPATAGKPEDEPGLEFLEAQAAPEQAPAVEAAAEQAPPTAAVPAPPPAPAKDESLVKVEKILEENLKDVFFTMSPPVRVKFKAAGEKLALQLRGFIEKAKASSKKVLGLIRTWLKMIPGVNRYFLDQEAKIKTDKIMRLVEEKKRGKM